MQVINRIIRFYKRLFWPLEKQALDVGVKMGEYNLIDSRFWSTEPYLISIGNYCQLTEGTKIHTHGGAQSIRHLHPDFDMFGKVVIEDWAYIGAYSQIMPGVTIGEGALVAAGSIVTKSVAPHTVVGGNPARYICTTKEFYERNKQYNVNTKGLSMKKKKKKLLSLPDNMFIKK